MPDSMSLMTIDEVAKLLHYSPKTVYKKAAKGEIPSVPITRRKRLLIRDDRRQAIFCAAGSRDTADARSVL